MAGTFLRWLIPGVVAVGGGTALALAMTTAPIATDLTTRARAALDAGDFGWAAVAIDGRDAILTGTATSPEMIAAATARVAAVHGVRAVAPAIVLADFVSPFPFVATVQDGATTLAGGYPSAAAHAAILADAGAATDATRLLSGGPDAALFTAGAKFGLAALKHMDEGEIRLDDLALSISGRARSLEALGELDAIPAAVPAGITLAALTVTPPRAAPYVWTARYDGARLTLTGHVPDAAAEAAFRAVPPANVAVSTSLIPASGAPSGFTANALELLKALLELEHGEAAITDGAVTLSGAPASAEIAAAVTTAVAALGGTATLEPPRIADFGFAIEKRAGGLAFSGFVPDAATRDRLAALPGADVGALALGRGAPERFASALDFGLAALDRLGEGRFELKGTRLSLGGRAVSTADFEAVTALAAEGAPQGLSLVVAELRPPVAAPFTFTATRDADGATTLAGYVPDAAARAALHAAIADLAADTAAPADGAPDDFAELVAKGLGVLATLDSGTLAYDGAGWALSGAVDTEQKGRDADAAFAAAGPGLRGWTYEVRRPTLPIISPYVWHAQKSGDGAVSITGFAPSESFKAGLAARVTALTDATTLGAGAPDDFESSAAAGLDALLALEEGTLSLDGTRWRLGGTAADSATRDAIAAALGDGADWQVTIALRTPEPEPEQEPSAEPEPSAAPEPSAEPDRGLEITDPMPARFVFEAGKDGGQPIALRGGVPAAAAAAFFGVRAGDVPTDALRVQQGLPADFITNALTGLDALLGLSEGRLGFDGARWWLRGMAETAPARDAIAASIAALPEPEDWSVLVGVLPPIEICREHVAGLERRNAITFQSGSAQLTDASLPVIDELAADLKICAPASVHVEGHTDSDGAEALNLALSVARAEAVVAALIVRGVDAERLYAEGYGESSPIASNDTPEGKAQNRRIAFTIAEE